MYGTHQLMSSAKRASKKQPINLHFFDQRYYSNSNRLANQVGIFDFFDKNAESTPPTVWQIRLPSLATWQKRASSAYICARGDNLASAFLPWVERGGRVKKEIKDTKGFLIEVFKM
jgi:hypothetical protein